MAEEPKLSPVEEALKRKAELKAAKEEATTAIVTQQGDAMEAKIPGWAKLLTQLDWKQLQPHQTALLLMQRTYTKYEDGQRTTYRLSFDQALIFAIRCFEIGLSPFSSEVWFNPDTQQTATTVEGRRKLARLAGMNFGPPQFTFTECDWPKNIVNKCGFATDIECTCTMEVTGFKQPATYTGRLSEWALGGTKGQWAQRPRNMLQTRMVGQCLTFASGIGVSEMPDETSYELKGKTEDAASLDANAIIETTMVDYKPMTATEKAVTVLNEQHGFKPSKG